VSVSCHAEGHAKRTALPHRRDATLRDRPGPTAADLGRHRGRLAGADGAALPAGTPDSLCR
jgi:hypothetical protein